VIPGDEAFEKLKESRLNTLACPDCGPLGVVPAPFVLFQPDQKRVVCHIPEASQKNEQEINRLVQALLQELVDRIGEETLNQGAVQNIVIAENFSSMVGLARDELGDMEFAIQKILQMLQASPEQRREMLAAADINRAELAGVARRLADEAQQAGNAEAARLLISLADEVERFK
jgi:ribosomal protein S25